MRRLGAVLLLGAAALLLTPGAPGEPDVAGDPTPPVVTPVITGALGSEGWYTSNVTLNWSVTDPESIILSTSGCDARTLTADTIGTKFSCTAESDGGETIVSKTFKLDKTAPAASASPSRPADANGWYNHALSVDFAAADTTSGVASCSAPRTYAGPDSSGASVNGSCIDHAGNAAQTSFPLKYDGTAPQASPAARQPDANGWFNHAVTVTFQGADGTSGIASCTQETYAGPDDPSVALTGTCVDRAGNPSSSSQFTLRYDETPPQATATASRGADVNGWHNRALTVTFAGSDALSGLESCDPPKVYSGPDAASASVGGSCRDNAGNAAPRSVVVKYDATPPQASATPSRQPNANGWYNAPLSVSFGGTDATSGNASCVAAKSYGGPDTAAATVSGTCTDNAGNVGNATLPLKYDATAPQASATPSRQPNANGWYNAPLTVSFAGTDPTSGPVSCDAAKSYSSPDSKATSVDGTCRDQAGNPGSTSFGFKYDATAPQVAATPSRQPNANGWYNAPLEVSFAGSDPISGVLSCAAPKTYPGAGQGDSATAGLSGTCLDQAGNLGSTSFGLKYDATAPQASATPSRQPNANGWYNAPLSVGFAGSDATSGPVACDAAKSYSSPDSKGTSLAGTCRDQAGNAGSTSFGFKYDATAPQVTSAVPVRAPDRAGWYNRPVVVAAQGLDSTSGLASCPAVTYSGPDGDDAPVAGMCLDLAGNVGKKGFTIDYDATGPQAAALPSRVPDANGWYNHALTVSYAGSDAVAGLDSCAASESYDGPDSGSAVMTGICFDKAGNASIAAYPLAYDATAPQVTGVTPDRAPDAAGWYNRALSVGFHGSDETSGVEACTHATYAGPDSLGTSITGSCRDRAANGSSAASFALRYDATAPAVSRFAAKAGNAVAALTWAASPDTALVEIRRSGRVIYRGTGSSFADKGLANRTRYAYTLTAYDEAGNAATAAAAATPTAPLVSPVAGARVSTPPRLVWTRVSNAAYYHVQVWRGRRILSLWPRGTSVRLRRTWTYAGRRYGLIPGRYRWFVWPGYGKPAQKKFGPLIGSSSFVVVR